MRRFAAVLVLLIAIGCSSPNAPSRTSGVPSFSSIPGGPASPSAPAGRSSPTAHGHGGPAPPPAGDLHPAIVTRVVDGDTVYVSLAGRSVDVRLIGVDTPETVAPGQPVECWGPQASAFTESMLEGRRVELEFDVRRIDPYGRTLAYVWLDGRLFNAVLVARGYARVATYPPDVRYVDVFLAAERRARLADRGLWRWCG
ncbi:MAG TPA: thermonuclease family protein [Actinomycetota bacterium]|nr:thermonuclease family protein [Actinomycetota bacterium]